MSTTHCTFPRGKTATSGDQENSLHRTCTRCKKTTAEGHESPAYMVDATSPWQSYSAPPVEHSETAPQTALLPSETAADQTLPAWPPMTSGRWQIVQGPENWIISGPRHVGAATQPPSFSHAPCDVANTPDYGWGVEPTQAHQRTRATADRVDECRMPDWSPNGCHPRHRKSCGIDSPADCPTPVERPPTSNRPDEHQRGPPETSPAYSVRVQ